MVTPLYSQEKPAAIIIMGVAGCGKSTVAQLLGQKLKLPYFDADDFHPESNKLKMAQGTPLTDEDRIGWLQALAMLLHEHLQQGQSVVLACSALKEIYREVLRSHGNRLILIHLQGSFDTIRSRMEGREHFMPPALLQSQFDTLEPPTEALTLDIKENPAALVATIAAYLRGKDTVQCPPTPT